MPGTILTRHACLCLEVRYVGFSLAAIQRSSRLLSYLPVLLAQFVKLLLLDLLKVKHAVLRTLRHTNELVELEMNCFGIAVLRALNQEHHQKCDNRCGGIDHKLPGIAEVEERTRRNPEDDASKRNNERRRTSGNVRYLSRHPTIEMCYTHNMLPNPAVYSYRQTNT